MNPQLLAQRYRPDIDGLRAIAVLSVVAFHAYPSALKGGFIGVDVFFVISGYLISGIIFENLENRSFSFADFYSRRVRRIFPALILVLAFCFAAGWFVLMADEYAQLGRHMTGAAAFISNFLLWQDVSYFDVSADTKPLLHLWSLAVEEQFYIFWPLLLWLAWKREFNVAVILTVMALLSFGLNLWMMDVDPAADFYSPLTRFWELLCGTGLAWVNAQSKNAAAPMGLGQPSLVSRLCSCEKSTLWSNLMSVAGIALLLFGVFGLSSKLKFPGIWAVIPVAAAVLILAAGPASWINKHILSSRLAVWFGLISYPLYLWHWPLLSFARIIKNFEPSRGTRNFMVFLAIFLAWLTYKLVERPFRYGSRKSLSLLVLLFALSVCGVLGVFTHYSGGMAQREWLSRVSNFNYDFSFHQDLGRPKEATVMLLGDSHAGHLAPGIKQFFGNKIADYSHNGCIPFVNVDRFDSRSKAGVCVEAMNRSFNDLLHSSRFSGVILSSMGPVYLTGEAFKNMDLARVTGAQMTLVSDKAIKDPWAIYAFAMRDTLGQLRAAGKKVLFVMDIPELGFDPSACYRERPFPGSERPQNCVLLRYEHDARVAKYRQMLEGILKDFPEVDFYDPTNDFCDDKTCRDVNDGVLLYRNTDHLGDKGSIYLVGKLKSRIDRLF